MTRIYLDSNIFRYLKSKETSKYASLFEKLVNSKSHLIFYYSYAHLSDLSRDKTDKKFDDLLFMEQLVDKNFLNLQSDEQIVNVQIASPNDAFNSMNHTPLSEAINFEELFAEMEIKEDDTFEIKEAKEKIKLLFNMPLDDLGIKNLTDPFEDNNPINRMLPSLEHNSTLLDLMKGMLQTFTNLNEDPTIWRDFRKHSIQALNTQKFDIDINDDSFNDLLKDTPLQKSFLEFVEETFKHNKSLEKQRQYYFFLSAYNCLNLLGLDKENNKKVVFASAQNDAQHAYYASHCEYLVSDDEQLLLKAKVLYKLFGIETKVLNLNEFESEINKEEKNELNFESFIKDLIDLFENANLLDDFELEYQNKRVLSYALNKKQFDYFNYFNLIIENKETLLYTFFNGTKNYSRFTSFIEFENITNKILNVLGTDKNNKGQFNEDDIKQILEKNWDGRIWHFQNESFYLRIEPNDFKLCFYFIPTFKMPQQL